MITKYGIEPSSNEKECEFAPWSQDWKPLQSFENHRDLSKSSEIGNSVTVILVINFRWSSQPNFIYFWLPVQKADKMESEIMLCRYIVYGLWISAYYSVLTEHFDRCITKPLICKKDFR